MIKLVALDLDGTLFSSFGTLSDYAHKTLQMLHDQGVLVVISSGRPFYSVCQSIPKELFDYASCMNGQDIYISKQDRHMIKPDLTNEEKKYLTSFLPRYRMIMECATNKEGHYYADSSHTSFVNLFHFGSWLIHKLAHQKYYRQETSYDVSSVYDNAVGKMCFCSYAHILKRFYAHLDHERFSCFFVNSRWLEIMHAGISKGNALQEIIQMESLQKDECAAFGDGENDISMLEVCGTRVAMDNAMRSVKKHATAIALPYTEDGCAKWIRENLLSK